MGSVETFQLTVGVVFVWHYFLGFNPCMAEISMASIVDLSRMDKAHNGSSSNMHAQQANKFYTSVGPTMKKINGCLPRAQDHTVLVIPPELVEEDVSYWSRHALICKFLGIRIPLSTLKAWIRRSW